MKDRRRNRLGHDKANKLVSLFHNLRMLKRMNKHNYSEPAIAWSVDLDHSAVTKYTAGGSVGSSALLKQVEQPASSAAGSSSSAAGSSSSAGGSTTLPMAY